ncbi:MAG: tRNA glutamyl-Q(34) synthetase GluQRS [Pseudomonadota bacterium]
MITRFAPSPTGPLHLGHAYSALIAHDMARAAGGTFLLRIEDIDQSRARPNWEAQIYEDLHWLGLSWPIPVVRQSDRLAIYQQTLDSLWARGLLYHCTCNRRDIAAAASAPQEGAPLVGPDGIIYPGTCRGTGRSGPRPDGALRLDWGAALPHLPDTLQWHDADGVQRLPTRALLTDVGDIVLARKGMGTSYHLAVTLDDAAQNVTHVTRGQDLALATPIHVALQHLLRLPTPRYFHHRLIRDGAGKRLAKRDDARALAKYRSEGACPTLVRTLVGLPPDPR